MPWLPNLIVVALLAPCSRGLHCDRGRKSMVHTRVPLDHQNADLTAAQVTVSQSTIHVSGHMY